MCFSATASITAGIVLSGVGVASALNVKKPAHYALTSIPIVFGVQQFVEGLLWISLTNPRYSEYQTMATYLFLTIAQVIWPLLLPVAFILFEKEIKRKNLMKLCLGTGVITALYFGYCLFTFNVESSIQNRHIFYALDYPAQLIPIAAFFYVVSTVTAPLLSGNRKIQLMGVFILLFYILSRLVFQPNLISVWCFFGTLVGILVYFVIRETAGERVKRTMMTGFAD